MRSREFIGHGLEHNVYRSSVDGWVLKKPRAFTLLILRILSVSPSDEVKKEIQWSMERSHGDVLFPEPRVFTFRHGYILAQRMVQEDYSVDKDTQRNLINATGNPFLMDSFMFTPDNFLSHDGKVFWVDLTFFQRRLFTGITTIENMTHIAARVIGTRRFQRVVQRELAAHH